jgi:hypothetical protein
VNRLIRRDVPLWIAFVVGAAMVLAHFIPRDPFRFLDTDLSKFFDIIAVFAFILGGGNLLRMNLNKIYRRHRNTPYSAVTVAGFLLMLAAGLLRVGIGDSALPFDDPNGLFMRVYNATFQPLGATMFSLLAFFVASASYRAFRARNVEATLLLISAFIILIGRTPVGYYLTSWLPERMSFFEIPNLSAWILSSFNTAGQRAIQMGIALGIISTSLKLILGIERSYLGKEE